MTKNRTEYHYQWRANNPEKVAAARHKFQQKHPYIPRPKPKPDPTGRLLTIRQEQIYRLIHPDFHNLTYSAAGKLLGICAATVCNELKHIKKVCPSLFPIYPPACPNMTGGIDRPATSYRKWMDYLILEKF